MNDYDSMSVKELLSVAHSNNYKHAECGLSVDEWFDAIESAIRKASIREASAGVVSIKNPVDGFPSFRNLAITRCETVSEWTTYSLIPKTA